MYGDFSRRPASTGKQYKSVLMQQGRVQLDADWNAQQDLLDHRQETETIDVIGPTGTPKENAGFAISFGGGQLKIGPGRYYVDGRLLENDVAHDLPRQPFAVGTALPAEDGAYLVYLDVFERSVSAIEDPALREVALGGPDTTVRTQVVWQVRLRRVGDADPAIARAAGDAAMAELRRPLTGRLRAQAVQVVAQDRPCLVPAEARYRRLENLLYRIEVHQAPNGTQDGATFKWSRDNGSVVSEVRNANGVRLELAETARDDLVRFERDAWVEVIDDRMELESGVGALRRIAAPVDHDRREITLDQAVPALDLDARPRVRLWNQEGNLVPGGIPLTNDWIDVEAGIRVHFEVGTYRPGDYWIIPARAALGGPSGLVRERTGDIEWPVDDAEVPRWMPRSGTQHHYAALAIVDRVRDVWALRHDLRLLFPPLTAITARDVSFDNSAGLLRDAPTVQAAIEELARRERGGCSVVIRPGDDVAARFAEIPVGQSGRVCFQPGRFELPGQVLVQNRGHLVLTGAGPGTVLVANAESALRFESCGSVAVRELEVRSGIGQGGERSSLRGALHFQDCADVVVERVRIVTRSRTVPKSTGITVHNTSSAHASSARVRGSEILAGDHQHGILLVNVRRSVVEDNQLGVAPDARRLPWNLGLMDRMIANARLGAPPTRTPGLERDARVHVPFGAFSVHFKTDAAIGSMWARLLAATPPPLNSITSDRDLLGYLESLSRRLLRGEGVVGNSSELRGWFRSGLGEQANGGKAITVGGVLAEEVRISRNRISRYSAGVHLGLSDHSDHRPGQQRERRRAGRVWIQDNALDLWLNGDSPKDRFGIFVGNCGTLRIEGNSVTYGSSGGAGSRLVEGVRVYGELGLFVTVRGNEISNCPVGIRFVPRTSPGRTLPDRTQWIVTDNLCPTNPPVRFDDPARGITEKAGKEVARRVRGGEFNVWP